MYDAIPSQLSKNAARYSISSVIPGEKTDRVTDIVQMMEESRVANIAYHSNDPNVGLALTKDLQRYKMYAQIQDFSSHWHSNPSHSQTMSSIKNY